MNNLLIVLLVVLISSVAICLVMLFKQSKDTKVGPSNLNDEFLVKLLDAKINGQNQLINHATTNQNKTIEEQIKRIDESMTLTNRRIESLLKSMFNDIDQKQQTQSKAMSDKNLQFEKQLVKIQSLDESLNNLQERIVDLSMILGNTKTRGTFGEIQLYQLIDNQFGVNNDLISRQDKLPTGAIVDLSIMSNSLGQKICIDSKFPLENFIAYHETGEVGFKNLFERDIKKHITDIKQKYIIGGVTVNFAIMFIPSEAIYLEIMENAKLVEYSYKQRVWVTSPTTLIALVTMLENINTDYKRMENISQIESELDKLNVEFERFNKRYNNLSRHMSQVIGDFEDIAITQTKLANRFEAIKKMDVKGVEDDQRTTEND